LYKKQTLLFLQYFTNSCFAFLFGLIFINRGPAEAQTLLPTEDIDDLDDETYGNIGADDTPHLSMIDSKIMKEIDNNKHLKISPRFAWPTRSVKPISEYSTEKLFCMAFPWLFPGGIGDINEPRLHPIYVSDWAQNLLYYEDGRFAKDNLWSFFVLNYIYRHRNQASSHFFYLILWVKFPLH
jgi:hypothetical protein